MLSFLKDSVPRSRRVPVGVAAFGAYNNMDDEWNWCSSNYNQEDRILIRSNPKCFCSAEHPVGWPSAAHKQLLLQLQCCITYQAHSLEETKRFLLGLPWL